MKVKTIKVEIPTHEQLIPLIRKGATNADGFDLLQQGQSAKTLLQFHLAFECKRPWLDFIYHDPETKRFRRHTIRDYLNA